MTARLEGEMLYGIGACDMKGGVAVALALAARAVNPHHDVTFVFYAAEEVEDSFNGLAQVLREAPELLAADFAILMEPSDAGIEAGCQGSMRVNVTTRGKRAHSARSWVGDNAIHHSAQVLQTLIDYQPRTVDIDGLGYREGLSAVRISGGIAGNVIPDECVVTVNYRYAPDRSPAQAEAHVRELFAAYEVEVTDNAPPALPGLDRPAAKAFVAAVGVEPRPKFGWTDVARFSAIGVPAVNFGPGDPLLAHTSDEHVPVAHLRSTLAALTTWLGIDAV
jgi:succinyl-diaminopimelate desuccinylase